MTVTGLPPAHGGTYVAWLYNSIIDSERLTAITAPSGHVTVSLPADASRYQWIDVSLQPAGTVNHSGQSMLRVANPGRHD